MKYLRIFIAIAIAAALVLNLSGCAGKKKKMTLQERRYNLAINKKARATAASLREQGHQRWCQHQRDQGDEPDDDC